MKVRNYTVKYRILDEPEIRELYHGISASSVAQATDFAEKMLINDGLKFSSFEIVEVREEKKVKPIPRVMPRSLPI